MKKSIFVIFFFFFVGVSIADSQCTINMEFYYLKKIDEIAFCGSIEENFAETEEGTSSDYYQRKLTLPDGKFVFIYGGKGEIDGVVVSSGFLSTKWNIRVGNTMKDLIQKIPDVNVLDTFHYATKDNYMFNFEYSDIFREMRLGIKEYKLTDPEIQDLEISSIYLFRDL